MSYEIFLAKRYAFSKKKQNFITIISVISMVGICVGTAALIIVLSVFNGFSSVVTGILVSFDPHLRITPASLHSDEGGKAALDSVGAIADALRKTPEVVHWAPTVRNKAVAVHYTLPRVVVLTGLETADAKRVTGIERSITAGSLALDSGRVVLGQLLATELRAVIGDTIEVFSPIGLEKILTEPVKPVTRRLEVSGIFTANNREYDGQNAYTSLETARELFQVPAASATGVDVVLRSIDQSNDVKASLGRSLDSSRYRVETWYDLHKALYQVMEIERWIAYMILFLIVAVASFNIFSSLTLTVFEKQRDIGLLRALGATSSGIRNIYLYQGILVGAVGTATGFVLGLAIVLAQMEFGFFTLDMSVYIIPALPVELRLTDFIYVGLGSLGLSSLGALMPSIRAARVRPAVALRWE